MAPVDDSRYIYGVLLDIECQMAMLMEPRREITVTFFSGPKVDIHDRVKSIGESNPWLVGTLVKTKCRSQVSTLDFRRRSRSSVV